LQVGNESTVLGFVGAPFTLATYIVEGEHSQKRTAGSQQLAYLPYWLD
jgi:uroporphyrinogen-III decarboxylase